MTPIWSCRADRLQNRRQNQDNTAGSIVRKSRRFFLNFWFCTALLIRFVATQALMHRKRSFSAKKPQYSMRIPFGMTQLEESWSEQNEVICFSFDILKHLLGCKVQVGHCSSCVSSEVAIHRGVTNAAFEETTHEFRQVSLRSERVSLDHAWHNPIQRFVSHPHQGFSLKTGDFVFQSRARFPFDPLHVQHEILQTKTFSYQGKNR